MHGVMPGHKHTATKEEMVMKTGIELIAEERKRQVEEEGWTAEHDAEHDAGELAVAGVCYAMNASRLFKNSNFYMSWWPWDKVWWRPTNDIRDLTKAGALIAAEIDRLQAKENS